MKKGDMLITPQGNEFEIIGFCRSTTQIKVDGIGVWISNWHIEEAGWKVKQILNDLDIVYAWDNNETHYHEVRIYDGKNKCTFSNSGKRDRAYEYDNYELVPIDHIPPRLLEAKNRLEEEQCITQEK